MIKYTKYDSDTKQRYKEMAWMHGRFFAIAAICVLPVSCYFFLAGVFSGAPEAIKMGIQTLTLVAAFLVIYLNTYTKTKNAVTANFDKLAEENKIDFTLEKMDDDTLKFTRMTDGETVLVARSDIKSIKQLKTIIVIILKDNKIIDVPKRPDIDEIIHFS